MIILIFRDIDRLTLNGYRQNVHYVHWYSGIFYKICNFLRVGSSLNNTFVCVRLCFCPSAFNSINVDGNI